MTHNFELDGHAVLGFDTGVDSRSFAQMQFSRFITEPGYIVRGGRIEQWKASGVLETSEARPTMVIWGPAFEGERLDLLLNENGRKDEALMAISRWIKAVLTLAENPQCIVPIWPCAALIGNDGIFFAPPNIAHRCLLTLENGRRYVHTGLKDSDNEAPGMDGAAFAAAAMLYCVLSNTFPFTVADESLLQQDMQEGNFLPIRFAVPGLDTHLAALIQNALTPRTEGSVEKRTGSAIRGINILNELLAVLPADDRPVSAAALVQPLSEADCLALEKEKAQFLKINTVSVKTRRFVMRNTTVLLACAAVLLVVILIGRSVAQGNALRPSTTGMEPIQVIEGYYNAFGELDHQMMEACVFRNAGKGDINMVVNLFVITRVRQRYELGAPPMITSAREWQQKGGGGIDSQVFGVTDLCIEQLTANNEQKTEKRKINTIHYRVNYTLWVPAAAVGEIDNGLPIPYYRSDAVSLVQQKKGWRITEIRRD